MIIDATDLIVGRLATHVAKNALLGEEISVVNCEKAVITGSKQFVLGKYKRQQQRGSPFQGPFLPRKPNLFVKRAIRGMLPYKKEKGRIAFKRIMCYQGVPAALKDKKTETIKEANFTKIPNRRFMHVADICHELGSR